ncbi:MAG: GGDEF domain-containing protein, partial [Campylobacterales bacterium]|nr:GGDEF domain-containing protein [Campylobacterales bacterium]
MRALVLRVFIALSFLSLCAQEGFARGLPERIDLNGAGWEYRWGDSPFEAGVPTWTREQEGASSWRAIAFPSNPPQRNGQTNAWYRVPLPEPLTYDPTLYVFSIDLIAEFYLDGQKIYQYGIFDAAGKGKFVGWPWHMISLPSDAGGKWLYVRVYSDYPDIGLWGEAVIGSKASHILKMFGADFFRISIGSVALFVGALFLVSFVLRFSNLETFLLSSLFLTQGLDLILSAKSIQFFFQLPLLERYMMSFNYFFFPVGMAAFLERIAGAGPFGLIRRIWQLHL